MILLGERLFLIRNLSLYRKGVRYPMHYSRLQDYLCKAVVKYCGASVTTLWVKPLHSTKASGIGMSGFESWSLLWIQLPAHLCSWKGKDDGLMYLLYRNGRLGWNSWFFLGSAWTRPEWCYHLGNEPADGVSRSLSRCVHLYVLVCGIVLYLCVSGLYI